MTMSESEDVPWIKSAGRRVFERSSMIGASGGAYGLILASIRNGHSLFYTISMGTNFLVVSFGYFSVYEGLQRVWTDELRNKTPEPTVATLSGAISGGFFGSIFAGLRKMPAGIVLGSIVGCSGFYTTKYFEIWRHNAGQRIIEQRARDKENPESK